MKAQICNECGCNIGVLKTVHLFDGKGVCGKCIKILAPGGPKPNTDIAVVSREARARIKVRIAADEDARYERAKRRVIFFLNGCVTFFWVIVLLHLLAIAVVAVAISTGFGG